MRKALEELEKLTENEGIEIRNFSLGRKRAFTTNLPYASIAINKSMIKSEAEEAILLAHEIGHYKKGAYYDQDATLIQVAKAEHKANSWAIEHLCPIGELKSAALCGCKESWEIAKELSIHEAVVKDAINYYKSKGLL